MRFHLPALNHGVMDPAPALYVVRINAHLGAVVLSAFPVMAPQRPGDSRKKAPYCPNQRSSPSSDPRDDDDRRTCRGKGASPVSEDPGRAGWLPQARSYLHHADPVLARLIDGRPDFDPRAWLAQLPPMDLTALLFQVTGQSCLSRPDPQDPGPHPGPVRRPPPRTRRTAGRRSSQLRAAGPSWRKINTLRDLAGRIADGRLDQRAEHPARR